jgi:lipopolysaccharide transport protein LptA
VAATIVAIALASPAWAQESVNTPITGTPMDSGTVGDSIRNQPANTSSAPPAASAPQPANSEDSGDDSISVTGGVPGAPPAAPASQTQAQPAVATAPAEAVPELPATAVAPAEAPPAAPAIVAAPVEAAPAAPAVVAAPAESAPAAPDVPVTAADAVPSAAPSVATTTTAPAAVAPDSTPETTAATVPPGAIAPPMVMAPAPTDAAPEAASAPPAAAPPPESATAPAEVVAAPHKARKAEAAGGDTKLASNPPQQGGAFAGMQFGNSKAPINIKSDSMSLDYQNHSVLWNGNVRATQADATLTSDQLRVNYLDKDFKQMKDMVADGNVRLSQGTRWATGKHGVMDQIKRTVVLTGSPVAHDGNDQITGCKITVYLDTSRSVVDCAHAVLFPHTDQASGTSAPGATAEQ